MYSSTFNLFTVFLTSRCVFEVILFQDNGWLWGEDLWPWVLFLPFAWAVMYSQNTGSVALLQDRHIIWHEPTPCCFCHNHDSFFLTSRTAMHPAFPRISTQTNVYVNALFTGCPFPGGDPVGGLHFLWAYGAAEPSVKLGSVWCWEEIDWCLERKKEVLPAYELKTKQAVNTPTDMWSDSPHTINEKSAEYVSFFPHFYMITCPHAE